MRHHVHLLMGGNLANAALGIPRYGIHHGVGEVLSYLTTLSWCRNDEGELLVRSVAFVNPSEQSAILDEPKTEFRAEPNALTDDSEERVANFLVRLFRRIVTIDNPGDFSQLLLTITLPLWDGQLVEDAKHLVKVASQIDCDYVIDVIALSHDLRAIMGEDGAASAHTNAQLKHDCAHTLRQLAEIVGMGDYRALKHIIPLQDINSEGFALNLDYACLTRILGHWSLLCVECYNQMMNLPYDPDHQLTAVGFSVLHLNQQFFVHYLMRRAYLHILDREGVMQEQVNIDKIAPLAQQLFVDPKRNRDFARLFDEFWSTRVLPLRDQRRSQDDIVAELSPIVAELFEKTLFEALQEHIASDTLTLPERKCILALVLAQDDEQLQGNIFNSKQLNLEDIIYSPLKVFVDENNRHKQVIVDDNGKLMGYTHLELDQPQDSNGDVVIPVDNIRQIRDWMRNSSRFIRQQAQHIEELKQQLDDANSSQRRLTPQGFIFEGRTFKLLPDITEKAFEQDYVGHDNLPEAVDLRADFMPVRSQGEQGSCSAFASVAVMEYMLKRTEGMSSNLSEAFVYYNARKINGDEHNDSGVGTRATIDAMHDQGVCAEQLCPYDDSSCDQVPSDEAYEDALLRRVLTAKNVHLTSDIDHNIQDLRSALADGFPVIIGLKVCNSFRATRGFVPKPSADEIATDTEGFHAMVVCGYSHQDGFFIVRNSWGETFGEQGYCYIPYSYVADPQLCHSAVIITEIRNAIGEAATVPPPSDTHKRVQFDRSDAAIDFAICSNLLEEEHRRLERLERQYAIQQKGFRAMVNRLCNQASRQRITEAATTRLRREIENARAAINDMQSERSGALATFDAITRKHMIWVVGVFFTLLIAVAGHLYANHWKATLVDVLSIGVFVILAGFYARYRKVQRKCLENEYMQRIEALTETRHKLEQELSLTQMRMHFAGLFVEHTEHLRDQLMHRYHAMLGFVGNLRAWHDQEAASLEVMDATTRIPFVSVLDNQVLDRYFDAHAQEITSQVALADYFKSFSLDEAGIRAFDANLRKGIAVQLLGRLKDFSMTHFVLGTHYPYLSDNPQRISDLLPAMAMKSSVFVQHKPITDGRQEAKYIIASTDSQTEEMRWREVYPQYFRMRPGDIAMQSRMELIVLTVMPLHINDLYASDKDNNIAQELRNKT